MYIVFEGIVGSGKTTQSRILAEKLEQSGYSVRAVREPGTTPIAEDIRTLVQAKLWENEAMHPLTSAYLYAAARAQMLHTVVQSAICSGEIVIADRSFLSSMAYQGEAQWLGFDTVMHINHQAVQEMLPDLVFFLDIDIDTALGRIFDAAGDKWERMGKDFFLKIHHGYEKCEKLDFMKNRFIRIDANRDITQITQDIWQHISAHLSSRGI